MTCLWSSCLQLAGPKVKGWKSYCAFAETQAKILETLKLCMKASGDDRYERICTAARSIYQDVCACVSWPVVPYKEQGQV